METFKEMIAAISNRIKSRVVSSILLSFIAINWKVIFFVLFEPVGSEVKFTYFDANTSPKTLYWLPIAFGCIFAVIAPWLTVMGQLLSYPADKLRKKILNNANHDDLVDKLDYEVKLREYKANKEQALIDEAKRDEVVKSISDPEIRAKLEQQIEEEREVEDDLILNVGKTVKVSPEDFDDIDVRSDKAPVSPDEFHHRIIACDRRINELGGRIKSVESSLIELRSNRVIIAEDFNSKIARNFMNGNEAGLLRIEKVNSLENISNEISSEELHLDSLQNELNEIRSEKSLVIRQFASYHE